jgi:Lhr-like helicase
MSVSSAGEIIPTEKESFAQEYEYLGILLEKIRNKESAILYKPKILTELARIQSSIGKQSDYESLTPLEKKLFVSKFQNNNLHCGYVTKVMDERNRLLLNKEIKNELGDILDQLIQ